MPGRKFSAGTGYRYGFNGKEKSHEITNDAYDFGARIYDPRLGKWLSVDPLQQKYPDLSTYQFCANSPTSAKDPDGRLIIFINGLWTPGTGVNAPLRPYWVASDPNWIRKVQDRIGDHANPLFYDGSLGGAFELFSHGKINNNSADGRKLMGELQGMLDAPSIIKNLKAGETIKIVTNSMGTAFARGFTKGVLEYVDAQNKQVDAHNNPILEQIGSLEVDNLLLRLSIKTEPKPIPQLTEYTPGEKKALEQIGKNSQKIGELQANLKPKLSVQFELEVDLSSHQVEYADENVKNNYYMTTDNLSSLEKAFVNQKNIKGATNLGNMSVHHSSGANPNSFPSSNTPDPNPQPH